MHATNLSFTQLRHANVTRCETIFHKLEAWSPCDWATAMGGECGEALNIVKKFRRLDGADHKLDTPARRMLLILELRKELADVVIYADLLAARMGFTLGDAVVEKFNEVSEKRGSGVKL